MKRISLIAAAASLLLSIPLYANCPAPTAVTYKCVEAAGGKKHCQWGAPWWDGYQGDAEMGEHPNNFFMALWGAAGTSEMGSMVCFYRDKHSHLVELSQNSWGGVPKPAADVWRDGEWPESSREHVTRTVCDAGVSECAFNYGA
jgi:hypothetical protein